MISLKRLLVAAVGAAFAVLAVAGTAAADPPLPDSGTLTWSVPVVGE
ncbi:hypothetical protein GCM10017786_33380 [Amycolatopsis deserti]|uniref:Uncharacterized protein n=1 Tax=Amycolatopsis deserti TaxID=185696 RepID=A0ABQ3J1D1_9PSEU|nr:hypothetical protein [Amycolatopsis deserti]GHE97860.1 hypothetical protein GCM10017786_33380 [Amycolatopsis deserti]